MFITNVIAQAKTIKWKTLKGKTKMAYMIPGEVLSINQINGVNSLSITHVNSLSLRKKLLKDKNHLELYTDFPGGPWTRALPGGVVVYFKNNILVRDIAELANRLEVKKIKKIPSNIHNKWFFESAKGINCLALVGKLNQQSIVKQSIPNWLLNINSK